HGRRLVQLRANFRKQLCPPIKCAAEKLNRTLRHQLVFVRELILYYQDVAADPHLEILRRRQNIHKACPLARTRKAIQNVLQRRFRITQVQPAASPQTKIAPASTHAAAQRGMNHQQTAAKATTPRLPMAAPMSVRNGPSRTGITRISSSSESSRRTSGPRLERSRPPACGS